MKVYESPTLIKIGSVTELTQASVFQRGQDNLSWLVPILGGPRNPGGGGGFGS